MHCTGNVLFLQNYLQNVRRITHKSDLAQCSTAQECSCAAHPYVYWSLKPEKVTLSLNLYLLLYISVLSIASFETSFWRERFLLSLYPSNFLFSRFPIFPCSTRTIFLHSSLSVIPFSEMFPKLQIFFVCSLLFCIQMLLNLLPRNSFEIMSHH